LIYETVISPIKLPASSGTAPLRAGPDRHEACTVRERLQTLTRDEAEQIAIHALSFIAGNHELLSRFLAVTGISDRHIRRAAQEPGFLAGVLQFYLGHEPTLLRFCEETGRDPATIEKAASLLPGGLNHHL